MVFSERGAGPLSWQNLGLALVVLAALVMSVLALTRDHTPPGGSAVGADAAAYSGTESTPTGSAAASPSPGATDSPSASAEPAQASAPPDVVDLRRADFATGDGLPDGAETFDNDAVGSPMTVVDQLLVHGDPVGPVAVSTLEVDLGSDVLKLGARILFAPGDSGSVVLAAWDSSFVASRRADTDPPTSGVRLVASAGGWRLTTGTGNDTLASGSYSGISGAARLEVVRDGDTLWVTDPLGRVTEVTDERVSEFAGSWASWQLLEDRPVQLPARIESVWAG